MRRKKIRAFRGYNISEHEKDERNEKKCFVDFVYFVVNNPINASDTKDVLLSNTKRTKRAKKDFVSFVCFVVNNSEHERDLPFISWLDPRNEAKKVKPYAAQPA